MQKVTKTFLRSPETMAKYMQISEERHARGEIANPYIRWKELLVKEFEHWVIIMNEFPYDAIAEVSHTITTKREVGFDWDLLTKAELEEFEHIKKTYIKDNYDTLFENMPRNRTVPGHFHIHLLVLKRE